MGYLRSDHLLAVLHYALEQSETSGIEVLDFGDNENDLDYEEQVEEINSMIKQLEQLTSEGHTSLSIIERDSLASLLLDSMSMNFSQDSSLDEVRTYFLNKPGMDDELIQEVYDEFKKVK